MTGTASTVLDQMRSIRSCLNEKVAFNGFVDLDRSFHAKGSGLRYFQLTGSLTQSHHEILTKVSSFERYFTQPSVGPFAEWKHFASRAFVSRKAFAGFLLELSKIT